MPDREKIIRALECCLDIVRSGRWASGCIACPYAVEKNRCREKMILDALALLKEQEWHMLTEDEDGVIHGLPGDDGQYLMADGKDIWIDDYVDGVDDGIILDSGRDIREITAWMYIPELPKQERR